MKALKDFLVKLIIKVVTILSLCTLGYLTLVLAHFITNNF